MTRVDKRWAGKFMQDGEESEMIIDNMNMWKGKISGRGRDQVGEFVIKGVYLENGKVNIVKQYTIKHEVSFDG